MTHAIMAKAAAFCVETEPTSAADLIASSATPELCKLMKVANYLDINLLLTATSDQLGVVGVELLSNIPTDPVMELFGDGENAADREEFTAAMRELGEYEPGLVAMVKKAMVGSDMAGVTALRAFENFDGKPVGLQILAAQQAKGDVKVTIVVDSVDGVEAKDISDTNRKNVANEAGDSIINKYKCLLC